MSVATTLKIGQWRSSDDSFQPHPASPTGAIFDLNDGTIFSLVDKKGTGDGLTWSPWQPQAYTTTNPHLTGSPATKITHTDNRELAINLVMGQGTLYGNWIASLHNLSTLCAGITPNQPAALLIQPTGSSTATYADVVAVKALSAPYEELKWIQFVEDEITLIFTIAPYLRGQMQTLQNLCVNPGFEVPSGPAVTVLNDTLANFNAYESPWLPAALADSPVSLWRMNETSGTTMTDSVGGHNGTIGSGVTVTQVFNGEAALGAYLYNGTTGKVQVFYAAALNTAQWTIEAWVDPTGGAGTTREILDNQNSNIGINLSATAGNQFNCAVGTGSGLSTVQGGTATLNTWTHVAVTYNGTTLTLYVNGSSVNSTATAFAANTVADWWFGTTPGGGSFWPGYIGPVAYYGTALSATRISAHYTSVVSSSGALAQDTFRYPDTVKADAPLVYYRLDEASGANCYDASGNAETATYSNSPTLGATSLLTGDTDTAVTLAAASSQRVVIPVTNLPTGNSAMTIDGLIKIAAAPGSTQTIFSYGAGTVANHNNLNIRLSTSAQILVDVGSSTLITSSAITTNAVHYVAVRWDGTTLTLNIDNAAKQTATPGNQTIPTSSINCYLGALNGGIQFLSATVDEWAIYGAALLDARISAHYTAATNAPTSTSNTMVIPAGMRLGFGSAAWGAYNNWQLRWRWLTGLTAQFFLHYTDSNNYLLLQMSSTTLALTQVIGGVSASIASASNVVLTNAIQYWLQVSQFPDTIVVKLSADSNGTIGTTITTLTGTNPSGWSPTDTGQPQLAASGAALAIGGNFSNVQLAQLFGPGGWYFGRSTNIPCGSWDTSTTYPNGPTTSFASVRIDNTSVAGGSVGWWSSTDESSAARVIQTGIPVGNGFSNQQLGYVIRYKTTSNGADIACTIYEYDSNGNFSISHALPQGSVSGSWSTVSGTYTTTSGPAYIALRLTLNSSTASATAWFDNIQIWNITTTGITSMPYCELRGNQGPFQWMVSGILGDAPSPALLCLGTYETTWNTNAVRNYYCGRRLYPSAGVQLVAQAYGRLLFSTYVLDSASYGGYQSRLPLNESTWEFGYATLSNLGSVATYQGTYEVLARLQTTQSTGNIANVTGSTDTQEYSGAVGSFSSDVAGQTLQLFTTGSAWTPTDWGRISYPIGTKSASRDLTTLSVALNLNGADSTGGGSEAYGNWIALLPHETEVLTGSSTNFASTISAEWVWLYADGIIPTTAAWLISAETSAVPNVAHAVAGPGSVATGIRPNADTFMNLDPTQHLNGTSVNQGVALVTDNIASLFACYLEFKYVPLYFFPQ